MTREYAIKILSGMAAKMPCNTADSNAVYMAISALREQETLAKKQATGDWISVKERRPEYKTRVLFVDVRGLVFFATDSVDWDDGHISFLESASGLWVQGSHWMPLPELPKEDVT